MLRHPSLFRHFRQRASLPGGGGGYGSGTPFRRVMWGCQKPCWLKSSPNAPDFYSQNINLT